MPTVNNFLKTKVDERGAAIKLRQEEKKKLGGAKKSKREIKTECWGSPIFFLHPLRLSSFFLPKEKNSDYLIGGIKFSQAPCWLRPTSLKLPANKHQKPGSINEADVLISHLWAAKQLSSTSPSISLSPLILPLSFWQNY